MSKKGGGRELISIEESIDASIQGLEGYIQKSTDSIMDNRTTIIEQKWGEKQLYGYFKQQTSKMSNEKTWIWPWKGNFKKLNLFK